MKWIVSLHRTCPICAYLEYLIQEEERKKHREKHKGALAGGKRWRKSLLSQHHISQHSMYNTFFFSFASFSVWYKRFSFVQSFVRCYSNTPNCKTAIEKSWKTETKLQFYFSFFHFVFIFASRLHSIFRYFVLFWSVSCCVCVCCFPSSLFFFVVLSSKSWHPWFHVQRAKYIYRF